MTHQTEITHKRNMITTEPTNTVFVTLADLKHMTPEEITHTHRQFQKHLSIKYAHLQLD